LEKIDKIDNLNEEISEIIDEISMNINIVDVEELDGNSSDMVI
jgi:hypothetical protein